MPEKSWNLPEYTTMKEGIDHLHRFKAIAVVNNLNFETSPECKSAKEAQKSMAKMVYDHFTISTPSRVNGHWFGYPWEKTRNGADSGEYFQELCLRKSWNLPEYTTVKEGIDHLPRFKAIGVVNGLNFETPPECKSGKEAQNSVVKMSYDHFTISTPPRVNVHWPTVSLCCGFKVFFPSRAYAQNAAL
ncbi:double-stranded RNA-binding protein 1-like [Henckelia pumila]|uniref:double-stranded RNA-binding protein 1-like n=1 Tax=Henckelia pumila TaxID=405737 RepID=UPI003C6E5B3F